MMRKNKLNTVSKTNKVCSLASRQNNSLSLSLSLSSRLKSFVPFTPVLLGALVLAIIFPLASHIAPVSATIDGDAYSLSLETSNSIELTLNPSTAGALSVAKHTVTGSTSSPSGYRLYVSTASDSNDIRLNDDNIIRATSATYNAPAALSLTSAQNAVWGYAIPAAAGFSQASVYETPTSPDFINAKFATMPVAGNEQLILNHTGTANKVETNIYYGVKANLGLSSGNYQGTIRYIAVSDATSLTHGEAKIALGSDTPSDNVELADGYAATAATITTSLNTDLDLSTNTTTTITISNGTTNNTCANPTISQATGTAVISCTIPAGLAIDTYNVGINITKGIHQFQYEIEDAITVKSRPILLTFNANGGTFAGGATTNVLTYSTPQVVSYTSDTKTTSTTNSTTASGTHKTSISDGTNYVSNARYYQDLTLNTNAPAPYNLTIYYATESVSYDWICVFDGTSYAPSTTSNDACTDAAARAPETNTGGTTSGNKIGGPSSGQTTYKATATYKLNSKTARIYFRSDGSSNSYGFWAEYKGGGDVLTQNLISGTYIDKPSDRSGYVFLGWATTPNATTPDYTYDANAKVMENTTVYAVWVQAKSFDEAFADAGKSKQGDYYKMQDMTSAICAAVQPSTGVISGQLIDTRDSKIYWVSKLADGHCWMTQNLDLDLSSSKTLKPADTNIASDWTPASTATTIKTTNLSSSNWATSSDYTHPYSFDGGNAYLPNGLLSSACSNKDITTCSGVGTLDLTNATAVKDNVNAHYHVGNLYTWTAAIAMNDSSSYSSSTASNYDNSPQTSICPKGWRLPNGASNGHFKALNDAYGGNTSNDNTLRAEPLFFARSGYVYTGSLGIVGSNGSYWSSTVSSSDNAYYLSFSSTSVYPTYYGGRNYGYAVRCVAQ